MEPHEVRYRKYEDGDMIQFGPNCLVSVETLKEKVGGSGVIGKKFEEWIEALKSHDSED